MILLYSVLIIMTFIGSVAAIFLKKATMVNKYRNIFAGGLLYFISALMNIYILKYMDYSVVLPLTSLTYIWTLFLTSVYFKEEINRKKTFGIILILIGSILVTK